MMKSIFAICLLSVGLLACNPTPSAQHQSNSSDLEIPYQENLAWHAKQVPAVNVDYLAASSPTVFYYDELGKRQEQAVPNGYYRQILGKTADGRDVAQDFYQFNQKAQTSPFVIQAGFDASLFDKSVLDSRVIWYDGQGNINSVGRFQAGELSGWLDIYEFDQLIAQLKNQTNGLEMRFFSPEEKLWGVAHLHQNLNTGKISLQQLRFFYGNGQVLSEVNVNEGGQPVGVTTFDEQGKVVQAAKNARLNEIMLRRFAVLIRKLPQLLAR